MKRLHTYLKQYYRQIGNRYVFHNGMSLNQLALEIWQRNDCKGMDTSKLSKILNGTATFTKDQLETFCEILKISEKEKNEISKICKGAEVSSFFLPTEQPATFDYLYFLIDYAFEVLYKGDCQQLHNVITFLEEKLSTSKKYNPEIHFLTLYLKGRLIGSTIEGKAVIDQTRPVIEAMTKIPLSSPSMKRGLINTLLANSIYIQADYVPTAQSPLADGLSAITSAVENRFLKTEMAFSYRNLLNLSLLTKDRFLIEKNVMVATQFLAEGSHNQNESTAMMHLAEAITLARTSLGGVDPFSLLEQYRQELDTTLTDRGNYTASSIKHELKLRLMAGDTGSAAFKDLLSRGLEVAQKYSLGRYTQYFADLSQEL